MIGLSEYNTKPPNLREVLMRDQRRTQLIAYGVAVLSTGLSVLLRLALFGLLVDRSPFITFLPGIILSAYIGGVRPGLLATLLSAVAADYFLIDPRYSLWIHDAAQAYALGLFVLIGVAFSVLMESLHRSRLRFSEEEQSRAQQAIREAEQRFQHVAHNMREIFWVTDLGNKRVMYVSPGYDQVWGRTTQSLYDRPRSWTESTAPRRPAWCHRELKSSVARAYSTTWNSASCALTARSGGFAIAPSRFKTRMAKRPESRAWPKTSPTAKPLEEALRESRTCRWRNLAEALPQLVWSATPDGANEYFSTQWTDYTGLAESETVGWGWLLALHPDDREPTRQLWLESVVGHQPYDVEYRVRRRDGEYRWFKTRGIPVRDSTGAIVKWFGTCTDITDLRQAQEALRRANERVELAVRGSNMAIWECDMPDGRIENSRPILFNAWELMGYEARTSSNDFGSTFAIWIHPDDQERLGRKIQELLASDGTEYENEYRVRTKDGSTRWHPSAARSSATRRESSFASSAPLPTSPTENGRRKPCGRARSGSAARSRTRPSASPTRTSEAVSCASTGGSARSSATPAKSWSARRSRR